MYLSATNKYRRLINGSDLTPFLDSTMFSFGERLGIFLTIEASFLSLASVIFILCFAWYRRLRTTIYIWRRKDMRRLLNSEDATSSILFLNLMLADLVQAFGNLPDIKWMTAGTVFDGRLCTTQAVFKQIGIVGVSMTSLAIAFHTFAILVLRWKGSPNFAKYVIIGVWAFTAFVIGIGNAVHRNEVYYGPTGYWCWILPQYGTARIVTEYLWVWVSGFFMIILYSIMFAVIRGWFVIDHGSIHWYNKSNGGALAVESDDDRKIKAIANSLLYYPAVYIFCVFPNTLARWLSFSNDSPPYQFTLTAQAIYGLSGAFNLILFALTRPKVVVGPPPVDPKNAALPNHRRHESVQKSPIVGHLSEYNYGILSVDIEKCSRQGSSFELTSPSRTMVRPRSSYDLQGVSSTPTRTMHHRGASPLIPEFEEVLDIG